MAHVLEILMKVTVSKSLRQIHRQLCLERGTVFSSLCPRMLRFHEATTNQPIRGGCGGIHRLGRRVPGRVDYLRYNAKDGCITGSNTTFESGTGVVNYFQVRGVNANGGHRVGLGSSGGQRF